MFLPISWWVLFSVSLVLLFFFPQTRKSRLAREVLKQWDEGRVRSLLESSGTTSDPRLRSAEQMERRISKHPGADPKMRAVASDLVQGLRQTTRDQRMVELMLEADRLETRAEGSFGSFTDLLDFLEARSGRLLGSLAELHGAVVKRDAEEVTAVLDRVGDVLREIEATSEVNRLLGDSSD